MELITERGEIKTVAAKWSRQYSSGGYGDDKKMIGEKLKELDVDTATVEDVNAIIGNKLWTRIECDECGEPVLMAVRMGQEPVYESATATICVGCLNKALLMAKEDPGYTANKTECAECGIDIEGDGYFLHNSILCISCLNRVIARECI